MMLRLVLALGQIERPASQRGRNVLVINLELGGQEQQKE